MYNKKINFNTFLLIPYTVWMIGFIIIPLVFMVYYGFTTKEGVFTFDNILSIGDVIHINSLLFALYLSIISTIICIVLAYPIALIFKSIKIKSKSLIVYLFILPMWMNSLLRTFAWLTLIEKKGIINIVLNLLKLPNINIINTSYAIILGMVYDFLPFMILPLYNSIDKIDNNIINAAKDLGATNFTIFTKIILPLSLSGMVSGIIMVFVPALTTITISDILGGGQILLIGNVIEQEFIQTSNWNMGSGLSLVLVIFIFALMGFASKYYKIDNEMFG